MDEGLKFHEELASSLSCFEPIATSSPISATRTLGSSYATAKEAITTVSTSDACTRFTFLSDSTKDSWDGVGMMSTKLVSDPSLEWDGYREGFTAGKAPALSWEGYREYMRGNEEDEDNGLLGAFAGVIGSLAGVRKGKGGNVTSISKTVYVRPPPKDGLLPGLVNTLVKGIETVEADEPLTSEQKEGGVTTMIKQGHAINVFNACKGWKKMVKRVHEARVKQVEADLKVKLASCIDKNNRSFLKGEASREKDRLSRDLAWELGVIRMVKYGEIELVELMGDVVDTASIIRSCQKWLTGGINNDEDKIGKQVGVNDKIGHTPIRIVGGVGTPIMQGTSTPKKDTAPMGDCEQAEGNAAKEDNIEGEAYFRRGSIVMHSPPPDRKQILTHSPVKSIPGKETVLKEGNIEAGRTKNVNRILELESIMIDKLVSGKIKKAYVDMARDILAEIREMYVEVENSRGDQSILKMMEVVKGELLNEIRNLKKEVFVLRKKLMEGEGEKLKIEIMEELNKVKKEIGEVRASQCAESLRDAHIKKSMDGVATKMRGVEEGLERMRNCIVINEDNLKGEKMGTEDAGELSWTKVVKWGKSGKKLIPEKEPVLAVYPGKGVDQPTTSKETLDKVKMALDVRKEGIMVKNIREVRNKGVVIELKDQKDLAKVVAGKALESARLKQVVPGKKNPELLVFDVPDEIDEEEFKQDLYTQNLERKGLTIDEVLNEVKVVKKKKGRVDNELHWVLQVSARVRVALLGQGRVFLGWSSHKVIDSIPVIRCFRCQHFGHMAPSCKEAVMCGKCAGSHDTRECPESSPLKCGLCDRRKLPSGHMAGTAECPAYQWAAQKELKRRNYNNENDIQRSDNGDGGSQRRRLNATNDK